MAKSHKTKDGVIKDSGSNIFNEIENLDMNFVYSKDLFSNFINFNMEINQENLYEEDSKNKKMTNLEENFFGDLDREVFQTEKKNDIVKDKPTPFKNSLIDKPSEFFNKNFSAINIELIKKQSKILNRHLIYDQNIDTEKDEELLKNLSDKQILKKMNVKLYLFIFLS
jgi:hypothetical protein